MCLRKSVNGYLPVASGIFKGQIEFVLRHEPVIAAHSVLGSYAVLLTSPTGILFSFEKTTLPMHVSIDINIYVF